MKSGIPLFWFIGFFRQCCCVHAVLSMKPPVLQEPHRHASVFVEKRGFKRVTLRGLDQT